MVGSVQWCGPRDGTGVSEPWRTVKPGIHCFPRRRAQSSREDQEEAASAASENFFFLDARRHFVSPQQWGA